MAARVLTNEEYVDLAKKAWRKLGFDPESMGGMIQAGAVVCKQVHRLLCDGVLAENLTPPEQIYAPVFKDAVLVKIPNDYGWEPGIEDEVEDEPALRESLAISQPPAHVPIRRKK